MSRRYLLYIAIVLTLPLQYGFHISLLNAPMDYMGCEGVEDPTLKCIEDWNPDLPSSVYAIGGLIGSALSSTLIQSAGLYGSLSLAAAFFPIGSLVLSFAHFQSTVVLSRLITGLGAGVSIVLAPIAIHKLSPPHLLGLFGAQTQISVNTGICIAQICGVMWAERHWPRIAHFATVLGFLSLASAIYLQFGTPEGADARLQQFRRHDNGPDHGHEHDTEIDSQGSARSALSFRELFVFPKYRYVLAVSVSIFMVQQLTGINAITLYGVHILADVLPSLAKEINLLISLVNLGVTILSSFFIDSYGRKRLLIVSLTFIGLCSGTFSFALIRGLQSLTAGAALSFVAAFAIGTGPIPFLYISEIAPREAVSAAQSVAMVSSWLSTFAVLALFPKLEELFGSASFYVFSVCTLLSAGIAARWLQPDRVLPATSAASSVVS